MALSIRSYNSGIACNSRFNFCHFGWFKLSAIALKIGTFANVCFNCNKSLALAVPNETFPTIRSKSYTPFNASIKSIRSK